MNRIILFSLLLFVVQTLPCRSQSDQKIQIEKKLDEIDALIKEQQYLPAKAQLDQLRVQYGEALEKDAYYFYVYARVLDYQEGNNKESAENYLKALSLFEKQGDKRKVAVIHHNISGVYLDQGEIGKAKEHLLAAMDFYKNQPEEQLDYYILRSSYARIFLNEGNYLEAAKIYLEVLAYYEQEGDDRQKGRAHAQVGLAYDYANMFEQAQHYYEKSIHYRERSQDTLGLINTYNNLGILHKNQDKTVEAIQFYQKALQIAEAFGLEQHQINPRINLGVAHRILGKYADATKHYHHALVIAKKLQMENKINDIYNNLSHLYIAQKDYQKAYEYSQLGIAYVEKTQNLEDLVKYNYNLALALHGLGRYKEASEIMFKQRAYADSLYNMANARNMAELNTQYETEKKEQQIELLSQQTQLQQLKLKQREWALAISILLLSLILLATYLIVRHRKLKTAFQLKESLRLQQEKATRDILEAEERERRRIAADLHDGVGQWLSVSLLHLKQLEKEINVKVPELKDDMQIALQSVKDSYDEMRTISHQMMPHTLLKVGLVSAIKEFVHQLDKHQITVNLHVSELKNPLDEQTETILYRVIQESINNVIKHAQATRLSIQLMQDLEGISATIEDNGKGFDKKILPQKGIGLQNMMDRVKVLQGFLEIDSSLGKGTQITVFLPNTNASLGA
jgi:two-component system NarL family sensor kinase